jgi:hypothetical protein
MFGYVSKNYWADREKVVFFLNLIFSAVRNSKFRHMFCLNKKCCSVKSRFPVHLPWYKFWTILALYRLFLGRFQLNSPVIILSCAPIYRCAKFRWKTSKNKICHFWQAPLAATGPLWNIFFITEWIALKLKILTEEKPNFFTIGLVLFDPGTQATELKKWTIISFNLVSLIHVHRLFCFVDMWTTDWCGWISQSRNKENCTLKPHCIQSSWVLLPTGTSKSTSRGIKAVTRVMAYVADAVTLWRGLQQCVLAAPN